ncbi:MAG: discoidin domain-containing protein [Verrucomicrobia bacterium]|nr:discoidin domain-containing protein [Verrucomicrobiota bacterium]MBI3870409.1 discoidin domain-containing protein [Verrucomicrobiota bacterium]
MLLAALLGVSSSEALAAYAQRANLALYRATQASSAAAADPAVYATDGIVGNENRWKSEGPGPQILTITWPSLLWMGSAHLYLGRDDIEPVASFKLQSWNGLAWVDIPGAARQGNTTNLVNLVFTSPIRTSKIRFYSTEPVVRVREIAVFPPVETPGGFPLGTDVSISLSRKRPASASSTEGDNWAKKGFDGYADDASRWKSAAVNGPHTLEVDLLASVRIGSAHLYSGSATSPAISNFTFEAWTGAAWTPLPGGAVVKNTNKALRVPFTTPVAGSKIRLMIPSDPAPQVRELAVFAADGIGGIPLGADVVVGPAPGTRFDTYGDGFWRIINRANSKALLLDAGGGTQATNGQPASDAWFQLLYNIDTDSFRLRRQKTLRCLAARDADVVAGAGLAESGDYQGLPHEVWRFQDAGSGDFRILNGASGLALESDLAARPTVSLMPVTNLARQLWRFEYAAHYPKKGTGGYEADWAKYGASWSYNWGRDTGAALPESVAFVPMQHNRWWPDWGTLPQYRSPWHTSAKAVYVLGFNEPDHADQANMSVADAIALWPSLEAVDLPLVSPAAANAYGGWLGDFYAQAEAKHLRVDFTAVHWYGNPDPNNLINHLQSVYNTWGRPVWLTEFSCVDWGGGATWTEEDNYRFLAEFLWRAEDYVWLKRYAIFLFSGDPPAAPWSRVGARSNMLKSDGQTLTAFGELYASWDGDRALHDRNAYLVHNLSADHRLRNAPGDTVPSAANIRFSDRDCQWAYAPGTTSGKVTLVSLRDGRRLRSEGTSVDLAPPGSVGASVEWQIVPDANGYFFLDHSGDNKRLRLARVDDANGAPTSIGYAMESAGTVRDSVRWRFIKPVQPTDVSGPPPTTGLHVVATTNQLRLTWNASTAPDLLRYVVYRASTPTGGFVRVAPSLTATSFLDTNVVYGATYRYEVVAVDWIENESARSAEASGRLLPRPGTYDAWVLSAFGSGAGDAARTAFDADPDADGVVNGFEYLFGSHPLQTSDSLFSARLAADGGLLFDYAENRLALDLDVRLESTSTPWDVGAWTTLEVQEVSRVEKAGVDQVTVKPATSPPSPRFFRLQISKRAGG